MNDLLKKLLFERRVRVGVQKRETRQTKWTTSSRAVFMTYERKLMIWKISLKRMVKIDVKSF